MTPVIGTPPSDDPPPRGARRIWTGDWLSESERARRAAEEAAARLEADVAERQRERPVREPQDEAVGAADPDAYRRRRRERDRSGRRFSLRAAVALGAVVALL